MNIKGSTGISFSGAYTKIDEYSCDKTNTVSARMRSYASKEMEQEGKSPIEGSELIVSLKCDYSDDAVNTKKQIYTHLKKLPEYEHAIDVLEE